MEDEDEDENVEIDPITVDTRNTDCKAALRRAYRLPGKLQPEMIATFKEISKLWHQFLESAEEGKGKKAPKRKQGSQSQKTDSKQQQQSTDSPAQMTIRSSKRSKKTTQEQEEALAQKKKISEKKS
ncbi:hypothetical protein SNK04_013851 [Fusarium graminearum]